MITDRRSAIKTLGAIAAATLSPTIAAAGRSTQKTIFPPRLKPGDVCGLINPAGATFHPDDINIAEETLQALGLRTKRGQHLLDRYGYLAGKDTDRASDINSMFADPDVKAIITVRGGWGCNRLLPLLDYKSISKNPKILMGYSDITSLLIAIYAKTGLVTFHGPVGISTWNDFTVELVNRILFKGSILLMENPEKRNNLGVQTDNRIRTISAGTAEGRLVGGNLSVLTAMVGSPYLPDWKNKILFIEEVREDIYRIDRMLTQLKLAGILEQLNGFIFGKCTKCNSSETYGSLTLEEVIDDHIKPLGIPAWYGSMIGHIEDKFTVPLGVSVKIDAQTGTIQMLEAAVE